MAFFQNDIYIHIYISHTYKTHIYVTLIGTVEMPNKGANGTRKVTLKTEVTFFKGVFIIYKYTVAVFRYTRRRHQIPLQMVVSHHVDAGI